MFISTPETERCPKCQRDVWITTFEYPADQKSDCVAEGCPISLKYLAARPEFPEPGEIIFVHQISFDEPESE